MCACVCVFYVGMKLNTLTQILSIYINKLLYTYANILFVSPSLFQYIYIYICVCMCSNSIVPPEVYFFFLVQLKYKTNKQTKNRWKNTEFKKKHFFLSFFPSLTLSLSVCLSPLLFFHSKITPSSPHL